MIAPVRPFTVKNGRAAIRVLYPKMAAGYELITNQVLQKLPKKGIRVISHFYNVVLRQGFFPPQWKIGQIIMIQKPGKPADLAESCWSISQSFRNYSKNFCCQGSR